MFNQLDVTSEGVIDGATLAAQLSTLPGDVAAALRPRSTTFDKEFLAFSDFRDLVSSALASHAPNGPRYSLLPERGTGSIYVKEQAQTLKEQTAECSFAPNVNARSKSLANASRDRSRPIESQLTEAHAEYAARRLAAERQANSENERVCTFRPGV